MTSKKIYTGFDLIKLIAAVCIIAIHTKAPFLNVLGRLGVPFFAIVSSVLFFNRYQRLTDHGAQRAYLKKFCKRIFLLYATWQVIYIPLAIRQFRVIMGSLKGISVKNLLVYLVDFIFPAVYNSRGVDLTKDANGWGPSWYLLASIVAMPVLVYLLKIFRQRTQPVFLICLLAELYIVLADEFNLWTRLSPIMNHTFLRLLIYFCLGYLIVTYRERLAAWPLKQSLLLFGLFLCLFFLENFLVYNYKGNFNTEELITTVPTGFLLAVVAMKIQPALRYPIQVRNLSTFLYCFQVWPIVVLRKVFELVGLGKYHLVLFGSVLLVALIAAYLYEQCRQRYQWRFLKNMV